MEITEHRYAYTSDQSVAFLAAGPSNGHLIVLCHGWPAIARTWTPQIRALAESGYRVVALDMPGYGSSTVLEQPSDYSLRNVNRMMSELLVHLGRDQAVWIGHDWGAVAVWSFAAHYPDQTTAVVGLARPYHTLELGLEEVIATVNRDVYPAVTYPNGQYDYQVYFETAFEAVTKWMEADIDGILKAVYSKGHAAEVGRPGLTATVTTTGGWFGGAPVPPAQLAQIPFEHLCVDAVMFALISESIKQTGFRGANAWYMNHADNRAYSLNESVDAGVLSMPALFIGANWDPISDISISSIADAQKKYCKDLTVVNVDAGHWVALEQPDEVNSAISEWLRRSVGRSELNEVAVV